MTSNISPSNTLFPPVGFAKVFCHFFAQRTQIKFVRKEYPPPPHPHLYYNNNNNNNYTIYTGVFVGVAIVFLPKLIQFSFPLPKRWKSQITTFAVTTLHVIETGSAPMLTICLCLIQFLLLMARIVANHLSRILTCPTVVLLTISFYPTLRRAPLSSPIL